MPIVYGYTAKQPVWKEQDKECYNIWGYAQLPSAEAVVKNPAAYTKKILLPYKNGMAGFVASKIGVGVSVVDKASLYQSVSALLGDMICEQPEAERVMLRGQKLKNITLRRNMRILKISGTGSADARRQTKSHSSCMACGRMLHSKDC